MGDFMGNPAAEASTPPEAFNLVQDGVGIAVMPGGVCADAPPNLVCAPIGDADALEIILTWRSGASYRMRKMVTEIGSELRRLNLEIAS